jgi:hypothetical protein
MSPTKHVWAFVLAALVTLVDGMPTAESSHVVSRQSLPKLVFAHFMVSSVFSMTIGFIL